MDKPDNGFFAVSLEAFHAICDELGMNECCLYIIYCCGSDKTNTKTKWSINALKNRTEISVRRAQKAASNLVDSGYVTKIKGGKHPTFFIKRRQDEDAVWLPKTFVNGANNEIAPLELIRRTGDHMIFRLIVDCYWHCDIAEDGGIGELWCSYDKEHIANHAHFSVVGFSRSNSMTVDNSGLTEAHRDRSSNSPLALFWNRLQILIDLGLIYEVPTIFDSEDGEPVVPLINPFDQQPIEELTERAYEVLPDQYHPSMCTYDYTTLILKTMQSAALKGVYVLRYRQHTEKTKAGYAKTMERIDNFKCLYQ